MAMQKIVSFFLIALSISTTACMAQNNLAIYPAPTGDFNAKSNLYTVTVYKGNDVSRAGAPVYVYKSGAGNISSTELSDQVGKSFNYSILSFSGAITVEVTKLNSTASSATVLPGRAGIGKIATESIGKGKKVRFTLAQPAKVSVEFDDDPSLTNAFVLFANIPESAADVPAVTGDNIYKANSNNLANIPAGVSTVYFAPGVYQIGYWKVPAGIRQIYVAGGAFVRGYFFVNRRGPGGQSIKINGRGIMSNDIYPFHNPVNTYDQSGYPDWYKTIQIEGGSNHIIEGLTFVDGSSMNIMLHADSVTVKNVNINGFKFNNDAITSGGSNNTIDNCFIRDKDDAIIIYKDNITVKNCVFWALGGTILQLGWTPHTIAGVNTVTNCDVIHADWSERSKNGGFISAMNESHSNEANTVVQNFIIKDIYFDNPIDRFVDIRMKGNNKKQPNSFKNFTFDNIHFAKQASGKPLIYLSDFDDDHKIEGFKFKNISFNGKALSNSSVKSQLINAKVKQKVSFQ